MSSNARHKKRSKNPLHGITDGSIRKLCRKAGVKRIKSEIYRQIRKISEIFLDELMSSSMNYKDSSSRKVLSTQDIVSGLNSSYKIKVYGITK